MAKEQSFFRSPFMASVVDTASNYKKGFGLGFSGNISAPSGWNFKEGKWSVGGMLSSAGLAPIGAMAGAYVGSQLNVENPGEGAVAGAIGGAAIGAAALPAIGLTAKGISVGAEALGGGIINAGKAIIGAGTGAGVGAASGIGTAFAGASALVAHSPGVRFLSGLSKNIVKYDQTAESLNKVKLTGIGKGLMVASALTEGLKGAYDEAINTRLGQKDNYITTATPRTPTSPQQNQPSYGNNAGASGDLVFALNNLRRG